jgi:hypothetical protein
MAWRIARFPSRFYSAEEPLEGAVDAAQGFTRQRNRNRSDRFVLSAELGQLFALLEIADRFSLPSPGVGAFLKRGIVEFRAQTQKIGKRPLLAASRQQEVLEGWDHRTDSSKMLELGQYPWLRLYPHRRGRNNPPGGAEQPSAQRFIPRRHAGLAGFPGSAVLLVSGCAE